MGKNGPEASAAHKLHSGGWRTPQANPNLSARIALVVEEGQAKRLRAHLEAGRALYNAVLSAGQKRLRRMRADPAWQAARTIPRSQKQERAAAFGALRKQYGFSEYALHAYATGLASPRVCQTLTWSGRPIYSVSHPSSCATLIS